MIRNVIVSFFLLALISSVVTLFFRGQTSYNEYDNSGARGVLEDFDILEYKGIKQNRMSRAKLGVLREDGIAELFTMIKSEEFDETEKIKRKALADHGVLQFNVKSIFQNINKNILIQKVELESNIHILDSSNNFVSEKVIYENNSLFSDFSTVVTDGNMSIYSKQGFVYDIGSGVLNIKSPVQGEIVQWQF